MFHLILIFMTKKDVWSFIINSLIVILNGLLTLLSH